MQQGRAVLANPNSFGAIVFMDAGLSIQQLRKQYTDLARQAHNILDGDKEYTEDAQNEVQDLYGQIDRVKAKIEASERLLEIDDNLESKAETRSGQSGLSVDEEVENVLTERSIFNSWLRGGRNSLTAEQRNYAGEQRKKRLKKLLQDGNTAQSDLNLIQALQTGEDTEGGYLVPTEFSGTLLEKMEAIGGVRSVADVIQTGHGRTIDWATVDETSEEGAELAENATATDNDPEFGTIGIGAIKYESKVITVSIELLTDNSINLEDRINGMLAMRIARILNRRFTTGTGVGQPLGFLTSCALGHTATSDTQITYLDLLAMEHSLDPHYRGNGSWMFHDKSLKNIKELVDANNRPLWRPALTSGDPDDILGYKYTINQHMPTIASGSKALAFGDFKKYIIRDVLSLQLMRFTDSVYAKKGQVGFLAFSRHDGKQIDASNEAIRHLVMG